MIPLYLIRMKLLEKFMFFFIKTEDTQNHKKITLSNFGLVLNGNWVYVIIDFEANKRRMLNEWAIIKIMSSLKRIQSEYQLFLFSRIFRESKRIVVNN